MNILLLSNRPLKNTQADTVSEHLNSFSKYLNHNVFEISFLNNFPSRINLNRFDAIIIHYSLPIGLLINHYFSKKIINKLINFNGLKISFLQDEYRSVHSCWENINKLGIDILFTCIPKKEINKVYPKTKVPNLKVINVLTGYVPGDFLNKRKILIKDRVIDVGYRSRRNPYWLGQLGYEKFFIGEEFKKRARKYKLKIDFSTKEKDRIYGDRWINFISSCKAMIGVESGSSIIDFDGKLEKKVNVALEDVSDLSYEEISNKYLKEYEGNISINQISPRCFEAAALKTPMILFEGDYSNILKPNQHFIPLKKDFSNFKEVIVKINDNYFLQKMANKTYEDIALNPLYSYEKFIQNVENVINTEIKKRNKKIVCNPYFYLEFKLTVWASLSYSFGRIFVLFFQYLILGIPFFRKSLFTFWSILPLSIQKKIRPLAKIVSK